MEERIKYEIRECPDETCGMRYPRFGNSLGGKNCPRCGAITEIAATPWLNANRVPSIPVPKDVPPLAALLDNIRSTFNVGSIFRTADGVGLNHLYLCGITPTPDNPKVQKTAIGAENTVNWSYHPNALTTAKKLMDSGARLWGFENNAPSEPYVPLNNLPVDMPIVIVCGNEISGIDPEVLEMCDRVFSIPMYGDKESFNVATAFGIAAYIVSWEVYSA